MTTTCPACGSTAITCFLEQRSVPVHSCLLVESPQEARDFPRGDIVLALCDDCGFITNTAFDPAANRYSTQYEETQACSPHFMAFAEALAGRWVRQYGLQERAVMEIGCGKGEFLEHMARAGATMCTGIDPGVMPERMTSPEAGRIRWIQDYFSEDYLGLHADAVVCRHTLEHIQPVAEFVGLVRRLLAPRGAAPVLFELPDTLRVLREGAFWDVYYEHCSYFTPGSLARLFRSQGIQVHNVELAYDGQYILLEGSSGAHPCETPPLPIEEDVAATRDAALSFVRQHDAMIAEWRGRVASVANAGGRVAIWGGGSKGVAFLHALGMNEAVDAAVDINPRKQGKFIAGTGHEVVAPAFLQSHPPALVIAMNPVYEGEIRACMDGLGVNAPLVSV